MTEKNNLDNRRLGVGMVEWAKFVINDLEQPVGMCRNIDTFRVNKIIVFL